MYGKVPSWRLKLCVATLARSLLLIWSFFRLNKGYDANLSHSAMLRVSSPKPRTPKFVRGGPTLLHLHSRFTAQSVTNGVRWTSIHGSPPLSWSSHCRSNTTTTQSTLGNYAFPMGQCPWKPCRWASGGEATPPHPYKLLGLLAGPLPHRQDTLLSLSQELGPSRHFPLAAGSRSP
jgi:hypothetical protein